MKVIIAGGRDYNLTDDDFALLDQARIGLGIEEVVCGCAKGADTDGEQWAIQRGIPVRRFPADWNQYGRSAGPRRNQQMAEYADGLIAFPGGKGTANMVKQASERGLMLLDWRTVVPANSSPTTPISDMDIYRAAKLLIEQHGGNAGLESARMFDALTDKGDVPGRRVWRRIGDAIEDLDNSKPKGTPN